MSKSHAIKGPKHLVGCCLVLSVACEFGGDRSLGTLAPIPASSADASVSALPQAGASGAKINIPSLPTCDPSAAQTECAEGQFCAVNLSCGRGMEPIRGLCQDRPVECDPPSGFEMVCGCDRQFHDSACLAWSDGISIAPLSGCEPVPCLSNADCERFTESCVDMYGVGLKGVACYGSVCTCGGTAVIM